MTMEHFTRSVFMKNQNVVFRQIGDESLLIPVANEVGDLSNIYNLNEIGTKLWGYLDGERSVGDICRLITDEYDVPVDVVMHDMAEFIHDLHTIRFLEKADD